MDKAESDTLLTQEAHEPNRWGSDGQNFSSDVVDIFLESTENTSLLL